MSLTKKQHQESTESYAAQGMHNSPMGVPPEMDQLHDRQSDTQLTSKRADVDLTEETDEIQDLASETDDADTTHFSNREETEMGHS
jgi:hypothetical protein